MLKNIRVKSFTNSSSKKTKKTVINEHSHRQSLLVRGLLEEELLTPTKIPTGFFAVYVGQGRERFLVPTSFLSHPLFKILLEKAYEEFGFEQKNGLIVPCSVSTFQEVVNAVGTNHGKFDMRKLFEEFVV
ncbi:protein SMALL AUXIN UP-REGULATED RNA 12 [Spinacia oleracea]|uniref:Protein SMALL AUXIN UP-REGULATED RNA 12 n=1 Tax=Spinacia oleracea TaxID=3562 RepID=A0ABM3RQ96_SPIOL|nr:protein SMALL AUXIN UP-REGULATED RNA 12 [Spinacia oleracea]